MRQYLLQEGALRPYDPKKGRPTMARRSRESGAEVLIGLVARLPWWASMLLAFVTYLIFHAFATGEAPQMRPGGMAAFVAAAWIRTGAFFLQFVVPFLCLVGAVVSFLRRKKRQALFSTVTASPSADALNGMSWQEFESLVGEAFRLQGYSVEEKGGARPDGGVDLVARKGRESFVIQCKQWRALKVPVDVVRELYGVMAAQGAAGGFVVTSGRFRENATAFALGRNVRVIDGPKLLALLQQARESMARRTGSAPLSAPTSKASAAAAAVRAPSPTCPKCDAEMVSRTARKGANTGKAFWGCSQFPACHGTRAA